MMNTSLRTFFFLFLYCLPILIVAQTETGFVYLKSGKTLQGQIFTTTENDDERYYFLAQEENSDTTLLNPAVVDRFAIVTSNGRGRKNRVFVTYPTDKDELLFVEPLRGLDNLFARPNRKIFYLRNNDDRLTLIPENKTERKKLFDALLVQDLQIFNASRYAGTRGNYKRLAALQKQPSGRYPGTYCGVITGVDFFSLDAITLDDHALVMLNKGNYTYGFMSQNIGLYLDHALGNKGKFSGHLDVALGLANSKEHFTPSNKIISYKAKASQLQFSASLRHYILRKGFYPFIGAGVRVNNITSHESLLVVFDETPDGYQSEVAHLESPLNNSSSPLLEIGLDIPIKKQFFISARIMGSQVVDLQNSRVTLFSFQLNLNVL